MKSQSQIKNEMKAPAVMSSIELNEQILFFKNAGMFIGTITEVREKAIKVDYCWSSVWANNSTIVFEYTTWIPKSAVINDEIGGLTVKAWFIHKGMESGKQFRIKPYYLKGNEKKFI